MSIERIRRINARTVKRLKKRPAKKKKKREPYPQSSGTPPQPNTPWAWQSPFYEGATVNVPNPKCCSHANALCPKCSTAYSKGIKMNVNYGQVINYGHGNLEYVYGDGTRYDLSTTPDEARQLITQCRQEGVKVVEDFTDRFDVLPDPWDDNWTVPNDLYSNLADKDDVLLPPDYGWD